MYTFLRNYARKMKKLSGPKVSIIRKESETVSTARQLRRYIFRLGMVHLNKSTYSRSVENVWNHARGPVLPVLMEMVERYELFMCRALVPARTTYATPQVARSLVAVAGDRFDRISDELEEIYKTIRVEGPFTSKAMTDLFGKSAREIKKIREALMGRLLITVFGSERSLGKNWAQYLFWTVDEWLANHDVDPASLRPTTQDEQTVLVAAMKCMICDDPKKLSKALGWPEGRIGKCLRQLSPSKLSDLRRPVEAG